MLYRALIKTHHMTSRKKVLAITKAAKKRDCAVYLKTGMPPGVMIGECDGEQELKEWVGTSRSALLDWIMSLGTCLRVIR